MTVWLLSLLLTFPTLTSASEGFHRINKSPLPSKAWDSVIGLRGMRQGFPAFGSAVILAKEPRALVVLTVAHNFENTENPEAFRFYSNPLRADLEVLKIDTTNDLALVRIETTSDLLGLEVARLPETCEIQRGEKLFAVGYPATEVRMWKLVGIENSDEVLKRWSQGVFTRGPFDTTPSASYDCMHGCSGGGVFNNNGELVGIHRASLVTDGYPYMGNDEEFYPHSFFIGCQTLRDFLNY